MKFESLIFDIDGTLWDSRELVASGYNEQLHKEGYDHLCITAEGLKALFGKPITEIAEIMFSTIPEGERYPLLRRCMEREQSRLRADPCDIGYPRVKETLLELKKKHRLFIVSNCEIGYPEILIEKLGLEGVFEDHMCFGDTGKPKGETIRMLMERNHVESAAYVGDTQGDYEATVVAGVPFIYCAYGFGQVEKPWKTIQKFEELLTLQENQSL